VKGEDFEAHADAITHWKGKGVMLLPEFAVLEVINITGFGGVRFAQKQRETQ